MSYAVRIEGLGKRYRRGGSAVGYRTLRSVLSTAAREPLRFMKRHVASGEDDSFWALKDVSLEIKQGERVGFIGRNGAGKSTLLRVLSRITDPTEGEVRIRGRVGSLLEIGTGFHPELTGRENVYLSGAILGMSRADIRKRFDEIVAFAEIEKFLDLQAKHYSSGMHTRLAFSVAAHLEPDILIVDEVLAVGDAVFQEKSLGKMSDAARSGRTVLFVSHNMAIVSALCSSAYLLDQGRLQTHGPTADVIRAYHETRQKTGGIPVRDRKDRRGSGRARVTNFEVLDPAGRPAPIVATGEDLTLAVEYEGNGAEPLRRVSINLRVCGPLGDIAVYAGSDLTGTVLDGLPARGRLLCRIPRFPVVPGRYDVDVQLMVADEEADWIQRIATMQVAEGDFFGTGRLPPVGHGPVAVAHSWSAG